MNFKILNQKNVLIFSLVFTLTSGLYLLYFAWKKEIFRYEKNQSMFELAGNIESISAARISQDIEEKLSQGQGKELYAVLDDLDLKMRAVSSTFETSNFPEVEDSYTDMRSNLKKMVATSDVSAVLRVLYEKTQDLYDYTDKNNWPTLNRYAGKLVSLVAPYKISQKNYYTGARLKNIIRVYEFSLGEMIEVTKKSSFTEAVKNDVINRVNSLNKELGLITDYHQHYAGFDKSYKDFMTYYGLWFNEVKPNIIGIKFSLIENSKSFLKLLSFFLSTNLILLIFSFWLKKREKVFWRQEEEKRQLDVMKNQLLSEGKQATTFLSENQEEFNKIRNSLQNRMSFGQVFQEALPFSALMLDNSLNLVWANKLFLENWNIETTYQNLGLTWEQLQRNTNLGENDPILEAHHNGIAGIYQIQIKRSVDAEALPFEMYVSPIEHMGKKRIMIFFYPLRSMEETLINQSRSLVGPVKRVLESMMENSFSQEFSDQLRKDFEVAGIQDIHELFFKVFEKQQNQIKSLLSEITDMEGENLDQKKILSDLTCKTALIDQAEKQLKEITLSEKQDMLKLAEEVEHLSGLVEENKKLSLDLLQQGLSLYQLAHAQKSQDLENQNFVQNLEKTKEEVKLLAFKVSEIKTLISQEVEQMIVYAKSPRFGQDKIENSANKSRQHLAQFQKLEFELQRTIKQFDLGFSKRELLRRDKESKPIEAFEYQFLSLKAQFEELFAKLNESFSDVQISYDRQVQGMIQKSKLIMESSKEIKEMNHLLS
jgi:hypothetical protein